MEHADSLQAAPVLDTSILNAPILQGRVIYVTGPAKGMGRDITCSLARAGADLILLGRDLDAIAPVADEARAMGVRVVSCYCDVTDEASVVQAMQTGRQALGGRADGLVCVHGTTGAGTKKLWQQTVEDYRTVFDSNVLGVMLTMREALKDFISQKRGSIVAIGGSFGFKGAAGQSLYAATKWALRGMVHSAALEAGPYAVRLNTVCPGGVDGERLTRQLGEIAAQEGRDIHDIYASMAEKTALRRMSQGQDIANAVVFLLSDLARNITGQDLVVDGGGII